MLQYSWKPENFALAFLANYLGHSRSIVYLQQQYKWGFEKLFVIPLASKNFDLRAATDFQIDSTNSAIVVRNRFGWFQWSFLRTFHSGKHPVDSCQVVKLYHSSPPESKWIIIRTIFPRLARFKRKRNKIEADKQVITELRLVPFVIINLSTLIAGVCMKVRFKSKVTRGYSFSPVRDSHSTIRGSLTREKIKKSLWDQGIRYITFPSIKIPSIVSVVLVVLV